MSAISFLARGRTHAFQVKDREDRVWIIAAGKPEISRPEIQTPCGANEVDEGRVFRLLR
jgi:hypothetical protein